jgi:hypothetical protein
LLETVLAEVLNFVLEVRQDGSRNVGVTNSLNFVGSQGGDNIVDSGCASSVGELVFELPDRRAGVIASREVAIVDVMSDVESNSSPPGVEVRLRSGNNGFVEENVGEII